MIYLKIDLLPPPLGEGSSYQVDGKDLAFSLDWSLECSCTDFMGLQMLEEPVPDPCCLPQELLHQLFVASDSSNLESSLKILIDASRTSGGRSDLASKAVLPAVLHLCQHLSKSSSSLDLLLLSLKLLRNLCAGELVNQNLFLEKNGIEILTTILDSCGGVSVSPDEITRMTLQVIANVSLAGEVHQHSIWHHLFPVKFLELAMVRRKEVSDPLCMLIYTCCDRSRVITDQPCRDQGISILVQIIRTASEVGFDENWLKLLLSRICLEEEDACFSELFSALYVVNSSGENMFTPEQVFLLSIVSEILNEKLGGNENPVSSDFAAYILGIFKQAVVLIDFVSGSNSSLPTGILAVDVLGYSLTILRDICANDSLENCITSLLSSSLIELLLQLLANLEPPESIKKPMNNSDGSISSVSRKAVVCPYRGFRRDIVAVIGNCVHRRKDVQNEVRERKGIFVLLQQCVSDEQNPFLREWGLWAVRNLLEGNVENQRYVSELELQGPADVPEITRLGLKVEVDPKTQRPRLVNMSCVRDEGVE